MLRFCDGSFKAPLLRSKPRATASAFPPALVAVRAPSPGDPEELPQLDTQFGQSLA